MPHASPRVSLLLALVLSVACLAPVSGQPVLEAPAYKNDQTLLAEGDNGVQTIAVVGLSSCRDLQDNIRFLGQVTGNAGTAMILEGTVGIYTEQLSKTKPVGVLLQTDGAQLLPLVCLPVDNLPAALEFLSGLGIKNQELGDGVYELRSPDTLLYAKQIGEWVYVAQNEPSLESAPADPLSTLAPLVAEYDLAARVMVADLPADFKQFVLNQLRAGIAAGMQGQGGAGGDRADRLRKQNEQQLQQMEDLLTSLDELTIGLAIDDAKGALSLDAVVAASAETELADQIASQQNLETRFAGFREEEAAVTFASTSTTPADQLDKQADQVRAAVGQLKTQFLAGVALVTQSGPLAPEDRERLEPIIDGLLDSWEATALAGRFDAAATVRVLPDGVTAFAGSHAEKTDRLEEALRRFDQASREELGDRYPGVQWDAATHRGVAFHTLSLPTPPGNAAMEQRFGDAVEVVFGFADDAAYFALGRDALTAVTAAIDKSAELGPTPGAPLQLNVALGEVVKLGEALSPGGLNAATAGVTRMLEQSAGADHLRVSVDVEGRVMRYHLEAERGVLRAIGAVAAAAMQQGLPAGGGF